jgi:hypothetical protein
MDRRVISLLTALALFTLASANADTLIVDGLNKSESTKVKRPDRGQSMEKVESKFGQPESRQSPVGDPPITRWEYENFVVYFEYQNVIHAVSKH